MSAMLPMRLTVHLFVAAPLDDRHVGHSDDDKLRWLSQMKRHSFFGADQAAAAVGKLQRKVRRPRAGLQASALVVYTAQIHHRQHG